MNKILLVEDDQSLGLTLKERLIKEGFQVLWADTVKMAKEFLDKETLNLLVLDVGLPDGDGFTLARQLRNENTAPIIFITAQGSAADRLMGYELGAEEYIPKPFHLKEFMLRVRHVLENHVPPEQLRVDEVVIDFSSMFVSRGAHREALNVKERQVLKHLIDLSPKVVSRDDLLNKFWGENEFPSNRTVDNVILRLRQVLGENVGEKIKTVRRVGYQWIKD